VDALDVAGEEEVGETAPAAAGTPSFYAASGNDAAAAAPESDAAKKRGRGGTREGRRTRRK
jgi:hypothetical protein